MMMALEIGNMLTTSVKAIKDYQVCALYYKYFYEDEIFVPSGPREVLINRFEQSLKKIASFYFYKRQAAVTPSYSSLINRWEKIWFPKDFDAMDMMAIQHEPSHGNLASYSNDATLALIKFHEDFSDQSIDPILIDEDFILQVDRNIRLTGNFDLILRIRGEYWIIQWCARKKRPSMGSLMLDFAGLRLAFEYRNKSRKDIVARYFMYDLASVKPGFIEIFPSYEDMNALLYWLGELYSDEQYVPRRGLTAYCRGCPFDDPCSKFKEWPDVYKN